MLKSIDLHKKLIVEREKNLHSNNIIEWVQSIFNEITVTNKSVLERLSTSPINKNVNTFNIDEVDTNAIFHISHIEKICINYRLRFLDTKYFKGSYPEIVVEDNYIRKKTSNYSRWF